MPGEKSAKMAVVMARHQRERAAGVDKTAAWRRRVGHDDMMGNGIASWHSSNISMARSVAALIKDGGG